MSLQGNVRRVTARGVAILGAVTATALVTAACGSSSSSSVASSPPSGSTSSTPSVQRATSFLSSYAAAPTTIPVSQPLKSAPPKGMLAVALTNTDISQGPLESAAFQNAVQAVGWQYRQISYQSSNPATLQSAFQNALQMHPKVVFELAAPESEWGASTVADYAKAGVTIVAAGDYPCTPHPNVLCGAGGYGPAKLAGQVVGAWFVSDSKGHGSAVLEHLPALPILDAFVTGFDSEVKTLCSACSIKEVDVTLPQAGSGAIPSLLTNALRTDPNAGYLIFDDGPFSNGITSALNAAGLGKIKVGGWAASPQQFQALRAGTEAAWSGFNANYQAWAGFDQALRKVEGQPVDTQDLQMPLQLLTKSTVGSSTDNWDVPSDALGQFEKVWHVTTN
jgi:ribose transport system substrate-binding protein